MGSGDRKRICHNPGQHLLLPGSGIWENGFEGRTLIGNIIVRSVRKFIKTVGKLGDAVYRRLKLENILVVRHVQMVSGCFRLGQVTVVAHLIVTGGRPCGTRIVIDDKWP